MQGRRQGRVGGGPPGGHCSDWEGGGTRVPGPGFGLGSWLLGGGVCPSQRTGWQGNPEGGRPGPGDSGSPRSLGWMVFVGPGQQGASRRKWCRRHLQVHFVLGSPRGAYANLRQSPADSALSPGESGSSPSGPLCWDPWAARSPDALSTLCAPQQTHVTRQNGKCSCCLF